MRVSAKNDYAIRALVELAARSDEVVGSRCIAAAQEIPELFLGNIMTELARHGLVRTHRGHRGGYQLNRPSDTITLADIIDALDGSLTDVRSSPPEAVRYRGMAEPLREVWIAVGEGLRRMLETVSLADIAKHNLPAAVTELVRSAERRDPNPAVRETSSTTA